MLAGENQRGKATRFERMGEGRQFNRFRPGADHQPYVGKVQPSPYLGGSYLPPLWSLLPTLRSRLPN